MMYTMRRMMYIIYISVCTMCMICMICMMCMLCMMCMKCMTCMLSRMYILHKYMMYMMYMNLYNGIMQYESPYAIYHIFCLLFHVLHLKTYLTSYIVDQITTKIAQRAQRRHKISTSLDQNITISSVPTFQAGRRPPARQLMVALHCLGATLVDVWMFAIVGIQTWSMGLVWNGMGPAYHKGVSCPWGSLESPLTWIPNFS